MIDAPRFVLLHKTPHRLVNEMSRCEGTRGEKMVVKHGTQFHAKPLADGQCETHLRPLENKLRQIPPEGFPEHPLGAAGP